MQIDTDGSQQPLREQVCVTTKTNMYLPVSKKHTQATFMHRVSAPYELIYIREVWMILFQDGLF